ncbi:MAG: molecular chaperone DnaJ [Acidimicrobiaceae bacterium]|jgi:molecular chaperone DnaJ|nr:molecular chaperone DnaJ [Acidimicrobiaceae bacterium]MDQ1364809.1 molecular chaperone DnaJ [Acidimicrobiaceae bacterium]MDQ1398604.1 molecular chaperone DnaJ [Acidimicrobiaceae bacterium]MDQ1414147.1 molecular chaperone DnaJ [Acidimicrobiaceae bacterium]MDQ1416051.1 molecular chaperone DnaJ [Acidimicrobiaceae bacterium]
MAPQREWFEKDYYKVLGVSDTATDKEITRAYRKLAKQYHPDANPGSEDRFKEISAAYDVLGDEARRKEYDEVRRLGPLSNAFSGATAGGGPGGFSGNFSADDLGDLLGGIFGRAGRGRAGSSPAGPRRGEDLEAQLHLSFLDAVNGVTATVNVTSDVACSLCGGTGAAPGTSPVICSTCGGRGVVNDNQGLFSFSQPCRDCGGTGMRVETPCRNCFGRGVERRGRQVKVRIPAGVEDGQRIRVKGRGGAGANGGASGDLYVTVHTTQHALFGRQGKNLTLSVPISFPEAALGATITVPTLDRPVNLKVPAGTRSGRTFRVKEHGVPARSGVGDLLVTVEVAIPQKLTEAEREAIEALASATNSNGDSPRAHLGV